MTLVKGCQYPLGMGLVKPMYRKGTFVCKGMNEYEVPTAGTGFVQSGRGGGRTTTAVNSGRSALSRGGLGGSGDDDAGTFFDGEPVWQPDQIIRETARPADKKHRANFIYAGGNLAVTEVKVAKSWSVSTAAFWRKAFTTPSTLAS